MPYKDSDKQRAYFREYDAKRKGRNNYANMIPEKVEERKQYEKDRSRKRKNEYQREWMRKNGGQGYRSYMWEYNLKRKFGLTAEEFHQMLENQEGRCAACRRKFAGFSGSRSDRVAVDHCHITGQVRGLLCGACNRTIGHAEESVKRLLDCADYLCRKLL